MKFLKFSLIGLIILNIIFFVSVFKVKKDREAKSIINDFHQYYENHSACDSVTFLGIHSSQYPADNWIMQELIYQLKPDFVVEIGTEKGGTTLFYATILEKINKGGKVISVDINPQIDEASQFDVWKERVVFIHGDSTSPEVIDKITKLVKGKKVLITLDSLHTKEHVLKELQLYSPLVSSNSYIVVQDTSYFGHPLKGDPDEKGGKEGPWEAVHEFLKTNKNFSIDHQWEKHLVTQYPSGFLKRKK